MKRKILIVDDSLTTLADYTATLEDAGYEVETCDNVWIAGVVARFRPDVLLMDVNLDVIAKGDAAIRALANRSFMAGMKVLLHSSLPIDLLEFIAAECGAHGFVHKNEYDFHKAENDDELLRAIAQVIDQAEPYKDAFAAWS